MMSEFVYIRVTFNMFLLTERSSSGAPACVKVKMPTFTTNLKDELRVIVSMNVSNFCTNLSGINNFKLTYL